MGDRPLADYALLSDCHTAALTAKDGSVDWLCFPRFDSPSVFARILDNNAGHWSLCPKHTTSICRRYHPRTLLLETVFETAGGTARLTDLLAVGPGEREHALGRASPHVLLRNLEVLAGEIELEMQISPRPGYGTVVPSCRAVPGGALFEGGGIALALSSTIDIYLTEGSARTHRFLRQGERASFALGFLPTGSVREHSLLDGPAIRSFIEDTREAWITWSAHHQNYEGPWADLVNTSGCVMQGLTYRPTGAMVAAPTTSLPENIGGTRNWDYRYSWLRDSAMTLRALWVAACPDEAGEYFGWIAQTAKRDSRRGLQFRIVYGVEGERDLEERELLHLRGWRGSRPVRIGNGAHDQVQLDVFGEIIDAAHRLAPTVDIFSAETRTFLVSLADQAARDWAEPDQGIWEVRGAPQHFVHSKLMCWVALDRAIDLAGSLEADARVSAWAEARASIAQAITTQGWSRNRNSFTQALGSDLLDASVLMMPIVGFLPASDPRVAATMKAIQENLCDERGLVRRYDPKDGRTDGIEGGEGTFLLCSYWLAECLVLSGRVPEAREVFERVTAHANDLGLLSEEVHPETGELLGNFPQAMSHIGLVNAAWAIAQAEESAHGAQ